MDKSVGRFAEPVFVLAEQLSCELGRNERLTASRLCGPCFIAPERNLEFGVHHDGQTPDLGPASGPRITRLANPKC